MTFMSFTRIVIAVLMTWLNLFNYTFNDYAFRATSLKDAYVFCYFVGNSPEEQTIHLAVSTDGYNFQALNNNESVIDQKRVQAVSVTPTSSRLLIPKVRIAIT
mgnify:CR=1 FL=1